MTGLWGELEQHIQQALGDGTTRACLLAGPVLDEDDPAADFGEGFVQYPLRFWKVMAVSVPRRGLQAFGFVLNQQEVVDRFGLETFALGRFQRYQVLLREVEALPASRSTRRCTRRTAWRSPPQRSGSMGWTRCAAYPGGRRGARSKRHRMLNVHPRMSHIR